MIQFCCKCLPKKPPLSDFFQIESKLHPVPQTPGALLSLPAILLLLSGIIAFWNEMDMWHNWHVSKFVAIPKTKCGELFIFAGKLTKSYLKKKQLSHKMNFSNLFLGCFSMLASFFNDSSAAHLFLLNGPFRFWIGCPLGGNGFTANPQGMSHVTRGLKHHSNTMPGDKLNGKRRWTCWHLVVFRPPKNYFPGFDLVKI